MKVFRLKIYSESIRENELTFSEAVERAYLYQKEFGILPRNFKSVGKATINKLRTKRDNYIKALENNIDDNMYKSLDDFDKIAETKKVHDFNVDKKLLKVAKDNKIRVLRTKDGSSPMIINPNQRVKPDFNKIEGVYGKRFRKKVENSLNKGEDVILYPSDAGSEYLAHEIGHKLNKSGSILDRLVSSYNEKVSRKDFLDFSSKSPYADKKSGIKEVLTRGINGRSIVKEESNASKKGLDLLKKSGAKKEDLDTAKNNLNLSLGTYKDNVYRYNKIPLLNILKSTKKYI